MKAINALIFSLTIVSPIASYAFTAGEVTAEDVIKEHQNLVAKYADSRQKPLPPIVEYAYGMDLDVNKVIRVSPDVRACKVMPQLMTYEDAKGQLNTVQYKVQSGCRGKN